MAAKDYKICCSLCKAYIAKTSKKEPGVMTDDRREITEDEILSLIDWHLDNKCHGDVYGRYFQSNYRKGQTIYVQYENDRRKNNGKNDSGSEDAGCNQSKA